MTSALVMPHPAKLLAAMQVPFDFRHIGGTFRNNGGVTDAELRRALAANVRRRMDADESLNSQPKLAARAGIGKSTVGYVLGAENDATIATIAALARAFGCEPWELLVEDEQAREAAWKRLMGR